MKIKDVISRLDSMREFCISQIDPAAPDIAEKDAAALKEAIRILKEVQEEEQQRKAERQYRKKS